jgi:hypothetical protein
VACGGGVPPAASAPPGEPVRSAKVVNASIVQSGCQTLGASVARQAERAMYELVEGCASVPGSATQFHATLQPGGRIEIAAGPGQPEVIPTCILKHSLFHHVPLTKPCGLDVKLEEKSLPVGGAAP